MTPSHRRRSGLVVPERPRYRERGENLSSRAKPSAAFNVILQRYFGCTFGSPPGLPGGGMIGVLPPPGGGAVISGSTLGGHSTPSLRASLSLRFSFRPLPVVLGLF